MHILVVDDEPAVRELTKLLLNDRGHTVKTASDGAEALRVLADSSEDCDVVLTDHNMPKVTGLELVQSLKRNDFQGEIVVWSGAMDANLLRRYKQLGVRHCLCKPVPAEVISRILDDVADALAA